MSVFAVNHVKLCEWIHRSKKQEKNLPVFWESAFLSYPFFSPLFLLHILCVWISIFSLGTFLWYRNEDILSSTSNTLLGKQLLWRKRFICAPGILLSICGSSDCRREQDKSSLLSLHLLYQCQPSNLLKDNSTIWTFAMSFHDACKKEKKLTDTQTHNWTNTYTHA